VLIDIGMAPHERILHNHAKNQSVQGADFCLDDWLEFNFAILCSSQIPSRPLFLVADYVPATLSQEWRTEGDLNS